MKCVLYYCGTKLGTYNSDEFMDSNVWQYEGFTPIDGLGLDPSQTYVITLDTTSGVLECWDDKGEACGKVKFKAVVCDD